SVSKGKTDRRRPAGGQFYLLIPNTDQAMDTIKSEADSISKWLLDSYMGELAFSFADVEVKNSDLKQGKFDVVMQGIRTRLAEAKMKKFKSAISSKSVVFELQYHGGGACASCDRRPAKDSSELCDVCELDEELSKKLAVASDQKLWLKVEASPCGVIPLPGGWSASIVKENEAKEGGIICYNLSNSSLLEGIPCGFLPYAGYVPRWRLDEYDQLPEKDKEDEPPREAVEQGCAVKSFSALARSSEGASLLGVLRADVDHLGMVFTLGTLGNASLSRISTLSSFLQFFFSWELIELISKEFPNTYVVYSGGDDVMLVGPWSEIIDLAEKIREKFSDFTGGNPNVTISAGIGTFKKASSIAFTSRITGEILEYAKFAGRDSISLFGTALKWKEFKKAREWMNIFYEGAVTDGEQKTVSAGLLYRLLGYQQMAMDYFKNAGKSAACKALFRPYLAYDIARNLGGEKTKNNKNLADLKDRLISLISANEEQWKLLPVAITWCLYKIRKGE
ncbi:MAG: type III-A CRISPR-associated protein Cas10/Csm1, partial [Armatimonadota bacterium]|nr:type III-A CRISPR-associated protein Cas10/Csm1 [Armatimonadota bacterium]